MTSYYPSLDELKQAPNSKRLSQQVKSFLPANVQNIDGLIVPGMVVGSDGLIQSVDETLGDLKERIDEQQDLQTKHNLDALLHRTASLSDLSEKLYDAFNHNRNTFSYWFPALYQAVAKHPDFFKIPKTTFITLPIALSQYMRLDWQETTPKTRKFFNEYLFNKFELDKDQEYFIKTGTFSSKFEFHNAHCKEPEEIGDYFHAINNFAMHVGAGLSNDLVVREWIADPENHDTIYDGMPLRTEFRVFIDCDHDQLIDVVPYWNPIVMKNVLSRQGQLCDDIQKDYQTYLKNQDRLTNEFNEYQNTIRKQILPIIDDLELDGCWSLDVMKSGNDFYLIDMADMRDSALVDLISKDKLAKYRHLLQ